MKIVKITALWCNSCLVMNRIFNDFIKDKDIEVLSLDYDMDEDIVKTYNPGTLLPVAIFYKDDIEVDRLNGEKTVKEIEEVINKYK